MRAVRNNPVRLQQKKNGLTVFRLPTSYKIPSSARLATSAEREVPRATCNEREARSSPRRNCRASPIKEKRLGRFSTLDFLIRLRAVRNLQRARSAKFPARLATSAEREVPRATLQRARSAKFPAQELPSVSDKRKTTWPFFTSRLPIRLRAVAVRGFPKTSVFGKFP